MKNIENKCMLITYADSMGKNLKALAHILDKHFSGVFGGVHVLPFFPSSGDRGFAVINYDTVDPAFGSWEDIDHLAEKYYLMADFMLNHVSIRSQEFQDYQKKGDASPYRDMFIHWNEFWPGGEPTEKDLQALYEKPKAPISSCPAPSKPTGKRSGVTSWDAPITPLWIATTTPTCWPGRYNFLPLAFPRYTMWVFWLAKMTWKH